MINGKNGTRLNPQAGSLYHAQAAWDAGAIPASPRVSGLDPYIACDSTPGTLRFSAVATTTHFPDTSAPSLRSPDRSPPGAPSRAHAAWYSQVRSVHHAPAGPRRAE